MSELRFPKINSIVLSGRLTRDPELRHIPSGTAVTKLSIAFDRSFQKNGEWQQETSYIDVTVWAKRGEQCAEQLHKGSPIVVEGYLKTNTYQDKEGNNRKSTDIVANKVSFLEKNESSNYAETYNDNPTSPQHQNPVVDEDDVPF